MIVDLIETIPLVLLAYFVFYKSALLLVWYRPLEPILSRLGIVPVCMDRSYHIYALRYRP